MTDPGNDMEFRSKERMKWPCDNEKGYLYAYEGDGCGPSKPYCQRTSVMRGLSFALLASGTTGGVCVHKGGGDLR